MKNESHAELLAALWPDANQVPAKVLECRHCGRRNRVQVEILAGHYERAKRPAVA